MNENLKNLEIDDFWKDCLNEPNKSNINNNLLLNNNKPINYNNKNSNPISFKNFLKNKKKYSFQSRQTSNLVINLSDPDYLKSKLISTSQSYQSNRKNIKEALIKEELIPLKKHKRQEVLIQKFINIYNKNKSNKDFLLKRNSKQKEKKENLQIKECTFKPEKCNNKRLENKINRLYSCSNIYERNLKLKRKYNEKIAILFNEKNKINNEYTNSECFFHPYINTNKNIEKILYDDNNIWKEQADNDSNKLFLLRYLKAREEEFDKKEILNSPVNKRFKYNSFYPKRMIRSLSQKDSLIMRRNLHDSLYSFKNLFTDEDENNNTKKEEKKKEFGNIINEKKEDNLQWTFAKKNEN